MNISILMTKENFATALAAAKPGTDITYHIGNLMSDHQFGTNFLVINGVRLAAWAAMEAGKVALLQQKTSVGSRYIARVLPPPHKPVKWMGCYNPDRFPTPTTLRRAA